MTDINDNIPSDDTAGADLADRVAQLFVLLRIADRHAHRGHGDHGGPEGRRGRGRREGFRGEIRSGQGRVLGILALQSPLSQKSLAYMLGVRPQSLSELVSKLEHQGLVTRSRDDADRRSFLIDLTEEGRGAAAEIEAQPTDDPFDVLTDEERETYSALTAKVVAALEEKFPEAGERVRHLGRGGRGFGPGFGPGPHGHGPHGGPHGAEFRDAGTDGAGFGGPTCGDAGFQGHLSEGDRPEFRGHGRGRGFRRGFERGFGRGFDKGFRRGFGGDMNPGFA